MKRLIFIVEGKTEVQFINGKIIPFFSAHGFTNLNTQTITSNRRKQSKGGVHSYQLFKNEVTRTLSQGNVIVTTLIDFFKLPTSFPNFSQNASDIERIEQGILLDFNNNPNLIPYIQLHEFESLLFSSIDGFKIVIDSPNELKRISEILSEYPNPEDINNTPETTPSKRCKNIFGYSKVADSELILNELSLETIRLKCPRFDAWVEQLFERLNHEQNTSNSR